MIKNYNPVSVFFIRLILSLSFVALFSNATPVAAISLDTSVSFQLSSVSANQLNILEVSSAPIQAQQQPPDNDSEQLEGLLLNRSLPIVLLIFFGLGLLLSFTPCVLPMIPILSSIIVGQGKVVSRKTSFILSSGYIFGMAVTYTLAGVTAALSGTMISSALQNIWVLGSFSLVFIFLALSMFGFYELQLPSGFQTYISKRISSGSGSLIGVTLMGAFSTLVVSPCVAAPLAGALLYIAKTGNVITGGAALFFMALGMGMPLLLVGLFAGELLPKAGAWMELIKKGFGILLLGVAVWLLQPVAPHTSVMLAWSVLFAGSGLFFYQMVSKTVQKKISRYSWQAFSGVLCLYGLIIFSGLVSGSVNPLNPVELFQDKLGDGQQSVRFVEVHSLAELESLVKKSQKPVMLFITADWCSWCRKMKQTFEDKRVRHELHDFSALIIDISESTKEDKRLLRRFGIYGPPGMVFLAPDNNNMLMFRSIIGYQKPEAFVKIIRSVSFSQKSAGIGQKRNQL